VVGAPGDGELARQIPGATDLTGKTSLMELAALMELASVIITNDSGPMHIAAAMNRPMVALFGPTNPVRTGPYGHLDAVVRANTDCSPCYRRQCPRNHECLLQLEAGVILDRVANMLTP
jgi:ADP-heptose:LPS heptosyltransferase